MVNWRGFGMSSHHPSLELWVERAQAPLLRFTHNTLQKANPFFDRKDSGKGNSK
jgi:hypothetical protein